MKSKLRKYNAGAMALTSIKFTIPPKTPAYVVQTTCPDHCTSSLINKPVIISQALNHMHLIVFVNCTGNISYGKQKHTYTECFIIGY
ncbi:hypothetical protein KUTeg_000317 [Tegillarca granosa]|uniref:Uncharacterized protein n=1 Tax=Tegillarca granosa TaxID=220873 RepID=A0ABQ9FX82_TEGGR|nr:hypothetical protein KUTeg_000317 [Tegillarca granosa]